VSAFTVISGRAYTGAIQALNKGKGYNMSDVETSRYTVIGLHSANAKEVLIAAVVEHGAVIVDDGWAGDEFGRWSRFADEVEAASPQEAEEIVRHTRERGTQHV
jgi:hypothetical protein